MATYHESRRNFKPHGPCSRLLFALNSAPSTRSVSNTTEDAVICVSSNNFIFMSSSKVYLITGANRGIGFGLVNEIAVKQPNAIIFATARNPSKATELKELALEFKGKIEVVKYVSGDVEGNHALAKEIGNKYDHVDVIIANAGICNYVGPAAETPPEVMRDHLDVNAIGVLVLFQAFFSLLKAGASPKFIPITSGGGSITMGIEKPTQLVAYGVSKVALNYISRKIHFEYIWLTCFPLSPGVVETDMVRESYERDKNGSLDDIKAHQISPEAAGGMLMNVIESSTRETHGGEYININGTKIPW